MSSAALIYADPVLISGTGPYPIPHEYSASGDIIAAAVASDNSIVWIDNADLTLDPLSSDTNGNLYLSAAAAATYDGATLYIRRATSVVQDWSGVDGAREISLQRQLDLQARSLQDIREKLARTVAAFNASLTETLPSPDRAMIWNAAGTGIAAGPTADEIASAQTYAEQSAAIAGQFGDVATAVAGAETAQAGAETAQAGAETAQAGAETAQFEAETAQAGAETAQAGAETAQGNAQVSAKTLPTWTLLKALSGTSGGEGATVLDDDTGTHPDLTATGYDGASVPNAGIYSWSAAWNGWSHIGDTGLAGKMPLAGLTGIPDGWEVYEVPWLDGLSFITSDGAEIDNMYLPSVPSLELSFNQMFEIFDAPWLVGISVVDGSGVEMLGGPYQDTTSTSTTTTSTTAPVSYAIFGDSLSAAPGYWPDVMAQYLGVDLVKVTRGSLTSTEIAALANASPTLLTFEGNTITGGQSRDVTAYTVDIVRNGGVYGPSAGRIDGFCYDVNGTKVAMQLRSNTDATYAISGVAGTATYTFAPSTPFYTDIGEQAKDLPKLICIGRNNIGAYDQIIKDALAIVNYGSTPSFRMMSSFSGKYGTTSAVTSQVLTDAARKRGIFGEASININKEMADYGIDIAVALGVFPDDGSYPTSADDTAKAATNLPDSFFATDNTHFTTDGHEVAGWIMANAIRSNL